MIIDDQVIKSKKNSQTTVIGLPGEPIWNQVKLQLSEHVCFLKTYFMHDIMLIDTTSNRISICLSQILANRS